VGKRDGGDEAPFGTAAGGKGPKFARKMVLRMRRRLDLGCRSCGVGNYAAVVGSLRNRSCQRFLDVDVMHGVGASGINEAKLPLVLFLGIGMSSQRQNRYSLHSRRDSIRAGFRVSGRKSEAPNPRFPV
jgi:hypothetical protein